MNFFSLINFDEKFNGFENVIFFHELLTVFLKCDKLIEGNEVMIGFNKVVSIIEVFINLEEVDFREERVVLFEGKIDCAF